MHAVVTVLLVVALVGGGLLRHVMYGRRDRPRPDDPWTEVRARQPGMIDLVVSNPSGAVLLVCAEGRRRPALVRRDQVPVRRRPARPRERLRTVDSFLGVVPPGEVGRWTVPVPARAARLYLVLSLSKERVRLHDHPIRPAPGVHGARLGLWRNTECSA